MSRFGIRALGLAALLALSASSAWAGSDQRSGTNGASELLIPVGPRASALGPSVASDISGAEATYWNPAGLASVQGTEALFSHTEYFADMKVNYAAIAAHAGNLGVVGFNAKVLSVGEVIVTTEAAPSVAQYHNRMPVLLDDAQFDDWMRGTPDSRDDRSRYPVT